jgi:hypothetical protein
MVTLAMMEERFYFGGNTQSRDGPDTEAKRNRAWIDRLERLNECSFGRRLSSLYVQPAHKRQIPDR